MKLIVEEKAILRKQVTYLKQNNAFLSETGKTDWEMEMYPQVYTHTYMD